MRVRRLYVESFGDDPISKQVQSMVIDSLMKTKRFVVTENRDAGSGTTFTMRVTFQHLGELMADSGLFGL